MIRHCNNVVFERQSLSKTLGDTETGYYRSNNFKWRYFL